MRGFLRWLLRAAGSFLARLLGNKPGGPYEGIVFDAVYSAHDEYRGVR